MLFEVIFFCDIFDPEVFPQNIEGNGSSDIPAYPVLPSSKIVWILEPNSYPHKENAKYSSISPRYHRNILDLSEELRENRLSMQVSISRASLQHWAY